MDFDFTSSDYDAFDRARDSFIDEVETWAKESSPREFFRQHLAQFLGWNFEDRQQPLRTLSRNDLANYLTGWLPRKYLGGAEDSADICRTLELTIEYLAVNGQLDHGFERAASLITLLSDSVSDVADALDDEANFGLSKSILSAPLTDAAGQALPNLDQLLNRDDLDAEQLQELLNERMNAFNALPFEERKRLTDAPIQGRNPIALPLTYVPPHPAEVEATASFANVVKMLDRFVEIAHDPGIALTTRGNIKLADARMLAEELETGDKTDGVKTSLQMRWVTLIDDLATAVEAVDRLTTKITADRTLADVSATHKAAAVSNIILEMGFLSSAEVSPDWMHELRQLLDDGVPHWLCYGLVAGDFVSVDEIVAKAIEVAAMRFSDRRSALGADIFDRWVGELIADLFTGLERFGLLVWEDAEVTPNEIGREIASGGHVVLTPLGRYVLPEHVRAAGYSFETVAGIEDASPKQVVDIAFASGLRGDEILESWRPDEPVGVRAQALADHVRNGDSADRMVVFDVFHAIDPVVAEPIVRQLLDSSAGSHAAAFLLDHGLATSEEVGGFIDLTRLVDMLVMSTGNGEAFDSLFRQAVENIDDDLLEELWRHDQPETALVLKAAGKHVTDKALAKRARAALRKHQSWLANQGR